MNTPVIRALVTGLAFCILGVLVLELKKTSGMEWPDLLPWIFGGALAIIITMLGVRSYFDAPSATLNADALNAAGRADRAAQPKPRRQTPGVSLITAGVVAGIAALLLMPVSNYGVYNLAMADARHIALGICALMIVCGVILRTKSAQ